MYELERQEGREREKKGEAEVELFAHNAIEKGEPCSGLIVADNSRPMQRHGQGHFLPSPLR